MEDTMPELLEDCRQKELYCMHNDVEDLIESALNSKLLSINLKSQRLNKEKQENKTSQISSVIANTLGLPTEEPDNSLIMGDEHLSTILEMELDEVIKSSVKNLVPIPSESKVTSDNDSECDEPVNNESSPTFTLSQILSLIVMTISPLVMTSHFLMRTPTLIDSSPKFDYFIEEFYGELTHIDPNLPRIKEADFDLEEEIRLVENLLIALDLEASRAHGFVHHPLEI
nr:hypothetical protein [Tanacetum cinerariifolium]